MKLLVTCLSITVLLLSTAPLAQAESASGKVPTYALVTKQIAAGKFIAVRYMPRTGAAWLLADQKWQPIQDKEPVGAGHYVVDVIGLLNDWGAARLDTETGKSWVLAQGNWVEISE